MQNKDNVIGIPPQKGKLRWKTLMVKYKWLEKVVKCGENLEGSDVKRIHGMMKRFCVKINLGNKSFSCYRL